MVQGMALLALPLWNVVGQKYGKKIVYYVGGSVLIVSLTSLYFVSTKALTLTAAFFIGSSLSIPYVIPYSMLPDVIESDEIATGKRREGIFFGFFTIFLKLSVTLALTFTNLALATSGYEKPMSSCGGSEGRDDDVLLLPDSQPAAVISAMRIMIGEFFLFLFFFLSSPSFSPSFKIPHDFFSLVNSSLFTRLTFSI